MHQNVSYETTMPSCGNTLPLQGLTQHADNTATTKCLTHKHDQNDLDQHSKRNLTHLFGYSSMEQEDQTKDTIKKKPK